MHSRTCLLAINSADECCLLFQPKQRPYQVQELEKKNHVNQLCLLQHQHSDDRGFLPHTNVAAGGTHKQSMQCICVVRLTHLEQRRERDWTY